MTSLFLILPRNMFCISVHKQENREKLFTQEASNILQTGERQDVFKKTKYTKKKLLCRSIVAVLTVVHDYVEQPCALA